MNVIVLLFTVSEVEEGAVFQIEDVWDGTQWHKSKKMLPDEAGDAEGMLMYNMTYNGVRMITAEVINEITAYYFSIHQKFSGDIFGDVDVIA